MGLLESAGIGAAITAAGGIASSFASNFSNKNIQQQSNEFNERMLDKQLAFNKEMYQTQLSDALKYSDPSFIRQRQESAGYNSGVLAAGGNLGSATSVPASQGVTPPQSATRTADFQGVGDAIAGAMSLYNSTKRNNAEVENLYIENKYKAAKAISDLNESLSRTRNNNAKTVTEDVLRGIRRDMMASEQSLNQERAQSEAVARRGMIIQNAMSDVRLKFLPQQIRMELANGAADIALKKAQKALTDNQAEHEVQQLIKTVIEANGKQLENQFNADSYSNRLKTIEETLWNIMHESDSFGLGKTVGRVIRPLYE